MESGELLFPENSCWKQFKLALADGSFFRIKKRISGVEEFRKELLRLEAANAFRIESIRAVYWGTLSWANPEKITTKDVNGQGYKIADRLILEDVIPFDIDSDGTLNGLEQARITTLKLISWVRKHKELKPLFLQFSSRTGFHYPCKRLILAQNAKERYNDVLQYRNIYKRELQKENIQVCQHSLLDPLRILKITGSADLKSGKTSTRLTEQDLLTPFPELWKKINPSPVKETIKELEKEKEEGKIVKRIKTFIKPTIFGTKQEILILLLKKQPKTEQLKKYKAPCWHFLIDNNQQYLVSTKAFHLCRTQKIANALRAKKTMLPITAKLITTIPGNEPKATTSKAHDQYLNHYYNIPLNNKTIGKNKIRTTTTELKEANKKCQE